MMHMIQHTFTHPLTHSEVVALATSYWPMPCVIKILSQQPSDSFRIDYITELLRRKKDEEKMEVINRLTLDNARLKKEMDEAAEHINLYLQEIPTNPQAHNWLIRNGYKDESYQSDIYGQEIVEL